MGKMPISSHRDQVSQDDEIDDSSSSEVLTTSAQITVTSMKNKTDAGCGARRAADELRAFANIHSTGLRDHFGRNTHKVSGQSRVFLVSEGALSSARYVWYVVGLLALVNVFNYMDRMALAVLAPLIQADLALSDAQLGLLTGLAFALFYALCGIPLARWADRGIRRNIIALSLATWSFMTALSGAGQNFWHLRQDRCSSFIRYSCN